MKEWLRVERRAGSLYLYLFAFVKSVHELDIELVKVNKLKVTNTIVEEIQGKIRNVIIKKRYNHKYKLNLQNYSTISS